ncbi:hypothetical protein [Shewanella donghaensis]|uniref:hypothetical protein n=1 Tax=Shewanella donghaensis TaxID=238836 RepID=UPI0011839A85|nr:hypothetical protein [Shewanella donghaensis]
MSVIHAVGAQWDKAKWSHQLVSFWQLDAYVNSLFVGATTAITTANLTAALVNDEKRLNTETELTTEDVFGALFDGFLLLFVKEISKNNLTQAEALILQLAEYYAKQYQQLTVTDIKMLNQSQQVIDAMKKLGHLRAQRRSQTRNMG